jgi:hypothetical protein
MKTTVAALAVLAAFAQPRPSLDLVLERFHAYLARYAEQYSATVADERYEQIYTLHSERVLSQPFQQRLESEFAIMRSPETYEWLGFRDVRRVDGKDVGGTPGRLAQLMAQPSRAAIDVGSKIAGESARYNLGPGLRTINNPAIVIEVLDSRHHGRFRFAKQREERVDGVQAWVVRFAEHGRPTVVRSRPGHDSPSSGRVWIDPVSGALLKAELQVTVNGVEMVEQFGPEEQLILTVSFAHDAKLNMRVPVAMSERCMFGTRTFLTGEATYSGYRQFTTDVRVMPPGSARN